MEQSHTLGRGLVPPPCSSPPPGLTGGLGGLSFDITLNGESSIRVRPPVLHPESDFTDYTLTEDSFCVTKLGTTNISR